jgi:hypothetical protein
VSLPALGLLALALAWAHWRGAVGAVVIGADAIEVRRWGHLVERYDFADVTELGLGQGETEQPYVGIKLRRPPSSRTQPLPAWERECMIGWPAWDAVLPVEAVVSPQELLQKCTARYTAFLGRK